MPPNDSEILKRSLVSLGDPARLQRVLAKARAGGSVVVGALGGSITAGAAASLEEARWPNRLALWWRETFPESDIRLVNAGMGATGSDIGAHRVRQDLLEQRPDVVAIEYAVNDGGSLMAEETLEGVVRQILKQPNRPAAVLLFTMNNQGQNVQDTHILVGRHYGLPMVSFRDALWPEIEAGRLQWNDVEADEVHPNDRGHAWCARLITSVLDQALADLPLDEHALPEISDLPLPLTSNLFEWTEVMGPDRLTPLRNEGWDLGEASPVGVGWKATQPGSVLEFEVQGQAISLIFYRIKGATGIAEAQVDDLEPVRMDAWFAADWGGYFPFQLVARDLMPGPHRLRIRLLQDRNPGSTGNEFRVQAVLVAGLKDS